MAHTRHASAVPPSPPRTVAKGPPPGRLAPGRPHAPPKLGSPLAQLGAASCGPRLCRSTSLPLPGAAGGGAARPGPIECAQPPTSSARPRKEGGIPQRACSGPKKAPRTGPICHARARCRNPWSCGQIRSYSVGSGTRKFGTLSRTAAPAMLSAHTARGRRNVQGPSNALLTRPVRRPSRHPRRELRVVKRAPDSLFGAHRAPGESLRSLLRRNLRKERPRQALTMPRTALFRLSPSSWCTAAARG